MRLRKPCWAPHIRKTASMVIRRRSTPIRSLSLWKNRRNKLRRAVRTSSIIGFRTKSLWQKMDWLEVIEKRDLIRFEEEMLEGRRLQRCEQVLFWFRVRYSVSMQISGLVIYECRSINDRDIGLLWAPKIAMKVCWSLKEIWIWSKC